MRFIITLIAICFLASCTTEYQCSSYGGTNKTTHYGKKSQSKYANHNKKHQVFF
ncbi:MAG: hypothetical protein JST43_07185 [Bacteroidetes bacterium]|nr:hypothetical protein [Bacteroidota bacterium]MBS1541774.1 hypothetical protein [Bacteroidota bacterium]